MNVLNHYLNRSTSSAQSAPRDAAHYLPTLDGWRAIAVMSVIFYHDRPFHLWFLSDEPLHRFGFLGVELFFAISGFLICSRLLHEERQSHQLRIKSFYARRCWRILPPASLYLFVVAALGLAHVIPVSVRGWLGALFFYRNYYSAALGTREISPYTNHFWSLSVEEHFYIVFPLILILSPLLRMRTLAGLLCLSIAYSELVRHIPGLLEMMGGDLAERRTDLHLTALITGVLLSVVFAQPRLNRLCRLWLTPGNCIICLILMWFSTHRIEEGFGARIVAPLGFPLLVGSTALHPDSSLGRLLEVSVLRFIGRLSYSIYLWQQLFFIGDYAAAGPPFGYLQMRPVNFVATFVCALASYFFVERPLIRFGRRLLPPPAENRRCLSCAGSLPGAS